MPRIAIVPTASLTAALTLAAGLPAAAQTTIYVAPCGDDACPGLNTACADPLGPKRTIQAAIDASVDGDTILVADGVYTGPGNRDLDFGGRAIAVRSAGGAAACIIDCQASPADQHRAFRFHSGETTGSVVEGFTIRNGVAPFGGAVLCESGVSPTFLRCIFDQNTAYPGATGGEGGAIRCSGASPAFTACRFTHNSAVRLAGVGGRGGAIQLLLGSNATLAGCTFLENTAGGGGGIHISTGSGPTVTDCSFIGNWTADPNFNGGGGVLGSIAGHSTFVRCLFRANRTARQNAAAWFTQGATVSFDNCSFLENYARDGGGIGAANGSRATATNCLFARNTSEIFSSAVEAWNGPPTGNPASITLTNCTFADNATIAPGYAAVMVEHTSSITASNCIVWGNAPSEILVLDSGLITMDYSAVQGGWAGVGNRDADPLFVASGARPYALGPGSPCIDRGDPAFSPSPCEHDLAGACRVWDGDKDSLARVDMGALEFGAPLGDLDGDCSIGPQDLTILLSHLNMTSGATYPDGDLDADGDVDVNDLKQLMSGFRLGCP